MMNSENQSPLCDGEAVSMNDSVTDEENLANNELEMENCAIVNVDDEIISEENLANNELGMENYAKGNDELHGEDGVIVPEVGMKFKNVNDVFEFYRKYAYYVGFPIRKRNSRKGTDGVLRNVTFTCCREGNRNRGSGLRSRPTSQTGCKARLAASSDALGVWRLTKVALEHNHDISPTRSRIYRCNRQGSENGKRKLEVDDIAEAPIHKSYNSDVVEEGEYKNVTCTEEDSANYTDKVRGPGLSQGDAAAILAYFSKMTNQSRGFYFSIDSDEQGRIKNVFWADNRCRLAYKEFRDVVTFDTTYLTKKYEVPFAPFFGVNHHGQSTLLGCGLILSEDADTFEWLFKTWLECMEYQSPQGIITIQDTAMEHATEVVFPNTKHRWCLWHVLKNLSKNFGCHSDKDSIFQAINNVVYESQSPHEFEQGWDAMVDMYSLQENELLSRLYRERARWVPCFFKMSFWAGMQTSQQSESVMKVFDGYIHSKTSLKQFFEQYEQALRSKVEKELQEDSHAHSHLVPCVTVYDIERQFQLAYTTTLFHEFQVELNRKMYCEVISNKEVPTGTNYEVSEKMILDGRITKKKYVTVLFERGDCHVVCSCHLFEFKGILCRHAISVLLHNDVESVPEKYILRRWRRDASRMYTRVKINYNGWITTPGQERFDELCRDFTRLADLVADNETSFQDVKRWIATKLSEVTATRARSTHGSNFVLQGDSHQMTSSSAAR